MLESWRIVDDRILMFCVLVPFLEMARSVASERSSVVQTLILCRELLRVLLFVYCDN